MESLKRLVLHYENVNLTCCFHKPSKTNNLKTYKLHLKTSCAYHACQLQLLREKILFQRSSMKTLKKDFSTRKKS